MQVCPCFSLIFLPKDLLNPNFCCTFARSKKNKSGSSTGVGIVGIYWARNEHTTDVDSYVMWLPKSGDFQEQVMSIENSFSLCLVCPGPITWYLGKTILKPL
jgi:hypothetical protein